MSTQAQKQMKAFLTEFGFTPASRARIQVGGQGEEDEFDQFVSGKPHTNARGK